MCPHDATGQLGIALIDGAQDDLMLPMGLRHAPGDQARDVVDAPEMSLDLLVVLSHGDHGALSVVLDEVLQG